MLEEKSVLRLDGWLDGIRGFSFSYPKVSQIWQSTSSTCGVIKREKKTQWKCQTGIRLDWQTDKQGKTYLASQEFMVVKARTKVSKLYSREIYGVSDYMTESSPFVCVIAVFSLC